MNPRQIGGYLARARQACDTSTKAIKGSRGSNRSEGLPSNPSGSGDEGTDVNNAPSASQRRADYPDSIAFYLATSDHLVEIGSHLVGSDEIQEADEDLQLQASQQWDSVVSTLPETSSTRDVLADADREFFTGSVDTVSTRRRGRKVVADPPLSRTSTNESELNGILYYCTFCNFISPVRWKWKRHEREQHLLTPAWICAPSELNPDRVSICSFCQLDVNNEACTHRVQRCWNNSSRDFRRKAQLKDHLMTVHKLGKVEAEHVLRRLEPGPEDDTSQVDLTCYICSTAFNLITPRLDHIARHFEQDRLTKDGWDEAMANFFLARLSQPLP